MPVSLVIPVVPTAPSYDKIHMDNMVFSAEQTDYAKVSVQARIRLYYEDPITKAKSFSPDAKDIFIEDAQAWATQLAMAGDMRGVDAANYIKLMVSLLAATQTPWGSSTVS